jgi:hypothetical protein
MEFSLSIPLFVFDIAIIAMALFILIRLMRVVAPEVTWRWSRRIIAAIALPFACLIAFLLSTVYRPAWGINLDPDPIWSFRPEFMLDMTKHRVCDQ